MRTVRNAGLIALLFIAVSAIYFAVSHEIAGTATLALLGVAMGVMAYALLAGSAGEP
ncbi:MAG TPA: hypothetical protein VF763_01050 [Candidatus Limnocylindrales bacterium]